MSELVKVNYDEEYRPTVSGRELHKVLKIETEYRHWFPRMCEYGFEEGKDFNTVIFDRVQNEGDREVTRKVTDHQLTLDMAKEICMIHRNEIGKRCREYFLQLDGTPIRQLKWDSSIMDVINFSERACA